MIFLTFQVLLHGLQNVRANDVVPSELVVLLQFRFEPDQFVCPWVVCGILLAKRSQLSELATSCIFKKWHYSWQHK